MHTVMIAKQKGGIGASTMLRELSVAAATDGLNVALLDLDGQGTLTKWWRRRYAAVEDMAEVNPILVRIHDRQEDLNTDGELIWSVGDLTRVQTELERGGVDLLLVDFPGVKDTVIWSYFSSADLLLVPTGPSTDDTDALGPVIRRVQAARKPFAFVILKAQSRRSGLLAETAAYLRGMAAAMDGGDVAPQIVQREEYKWCSGTGTAVVEGRTPGAAEVVELWRWIRTRLS